MNKRDVIAIMAAILAASKEFETIDAAVFSAQIIYGKLE